MYNPIYVYSNSKNRFLKLNKIVTILLVLAQSFFNNLYWEFKKPHINSSYQTNIDNYTALSYYTSMKRVLLIEDNELNRKLILKFLQLNNLEGIGVETAEVGIKLLKDVKPDLILMDIMLPGMDGISATRQIKSNPQYSQIPIIAISALSGEKEKQEAIDAGCSAYIVKPIEFQKFSETVKKYIGE